MQSCTDILAFQPSSLLRYCGCPAIYKWLSSHHLTMIKAVQPSSLKFLNHQNSHSKFNRKFNRKINREFNRFLMFFHIFLIFNFQSRNQSRKFEKTTNLLKKKGFQSQIDLVQKPIDRLNFFNLGAFGITSHNITRRK